MRFDPLLCEAAGSQKFGACNQVRGGKIKLSLAARRTEDKVSNEPRKITPCVDNAGGFFGDI